MQEWPMLFFNLPYLFISFIPLCSILDNFLRFFFLINSQILSLYFYYALGIVLDVWYLGYTKEADKWKNLPYGI